MTVQPVSLSKLRTFASAGRILATGLCLCLLVTTSLADTWRFAVVGDTRGDGANTPSNRWVNTPVLSAIAKAISNDCPDLVLITGDLIYGDPVSSSGTNMAVQFALWTNAMAPVYQAGIPVYPVRGNHDASGDSSLGTAFLTAFPDTPRNGPTGEAGLTYSFTHNNAFFVALDQYCNAHTVNQAWLSNQLALNTKTHIFTFGHEPAVQVAHSTCLAEHQTDRNAMLNSLTVAGSRIYFCGHDHFYDHAIVTAPNGRTMRQMVVGTGGAPGANWSGFYGTDFGEEAMATNVRHIGYTNGYCLVTISDFSVKLEWKGSADLVTWQTGDTLQYALPNPAVHRINDYDGDSKSDPAIYDEARGNWTVLFSSLLYTVGAQPTLGGTGQRAAPGDYDGDGKTDIAVMNQTGTWRILLSGSGYAPITTNFGVVGAGPAGADYDGDGITDLAYYEKASGTWGILYSRSGQSVTAQWGGPGLIPASADFDGDDIADPALYQESTGAWYVLLSGSGYQEAFVIWGEPGYQATPGDYDNDGRADPCVYNRTTGEWLALLSGCGYTNSVSVIWGNAAYKPVPGDYDGDGRVDPMVYADSLADWSVMLSGSTYAGAGLSLGGTNWEAVKTLWREDLVFMAFGDSITYGSGSSSNGPNTGYPKLLETKLRQSYDGYFLSINKGIPGEDTYEGFDRFAETLATTNPNLVLLMEGTNDHNSGYDFDEIEENLRNMVKIALNRNIPVIIATIPPVITNAYQDRSEQMARIMAFNPRIYNIAADLHIPVAPVFEDITSVPGWESRLMEQLSANHPNDAGYRVVRDAFYPIIAAGIEAGQY